MRTVQLPLLPPVKAKTSWVELFGGNGADIPPDIRRERWEQWKRLADAEVVEWWSDVEGCVDRGDCVHLDGDWCSLCGLPASVNPILTMRHGMIGMACAGAAYEPKAIGA